MELWHVESGWKFDTDDCWNSDLVIILRQPFSNFCRPHTDDSIICGVIAGGTRKHFYADVLFTECIQVTGQGMFHQQAEKILALLASGERITGDHRFERTTN